MFLIVPFPFPWVLPARQLYESQSLCICLVLTGLQLSLAGIRFLSLGYSERTCKLHSVFLQGLQPLTLRLRQGCVPLLTPQSVS